MRSIFLAIVAVIGIYSCKEKKVSLSGNAPVEAKDFIAAFPVLSLPYRAADTNVVKLADTITISYTVFTAFIPDSVLQNTFGKNAKKTKIHPLGRIEKENELYLLANFFQDKKNTLAAFLLDRNNKYLSSIVLLSQGQKDEYVHSVSVTNEPTFILSKEKQNEKNEISYTRNGYAYNNGSGAFIAVLNDTNEDMKRNAEIINPIDTFPQVNKLSGDYTSDKRNYISIRDGSNPGKYIFFLHFDKNKSNCTGELKGEMRLKDAAHAYYQESGDPCVIDFIFSANHVTVKEQGNCGNHRGIKCFIDESYRRKKSAPKKK